MSQYELAVVTESCENCAGAFDFVKFLSSPEAQKIIMHKNVMLPVEPIHMQGTEFETLTKLITSGFIETGKIEALAEKKKALIERWKDLKL